MTLLNRLLITILLTVGGAAVVQALPTAHFAQHSRLAQGRWIKVAVDRSGPCLLRADMLRRHGMTDPSRVRVFGYPGARPGDALTEATVIDDLPEVPAVTTAAGVVFYAGAPENVTADGQRLQCDISVYTTHSYYFVTQTDEAAPERAVTAAASNAEGSRVGLAFTHHEQELDTPGENGAALVGEDFNYTRSRTFSLAAPGAVADSYATLDCSFVSWVTSAPSELRVQAPGYSQTVRIESAVNDSHYMGNESKSTHSIRMDGPKLAVSLTYMPGGGCQGAWLNSLTLTYQRSLTLDGGPLTFHSADSRLTLSTPDPGRTHVWDVTDPTDIRRVVTGAGDRTVSWETTAEGMRRYAAFVEGSELLQPTSVTTVANQDLHALGSADMIIYAYPQWLDQARRLAAFHAGAPDSLTTHVVNVLEVYNEFGSGAADVNALRRFNKMIYDRGEGQTHRLKYVLLMGSSTFDERQLLQSTRNRRPFSIPSWQTRSMAQSLSCNSGYGTDDYIAMLEDDPIGSLGLAKLSVAVGRMPVTSNADARMAVDKVIQYSTASKRSTWRNRVLMVSDDGNMGVHSTQSEQFEANTRKERDEQFLFAKMYTDSYDYEGKVPLAGRDDMYRLLREGCLWWTYVGHGNPQRWSDNNILLTTDISNFYAPQAPVLYAATCDFLRWDSNTVSGAELMYMRQHGGLAAVISATRPVNIADNEYMTNAMGHSIARRDAAGRHYPLGEVYRWAKNNLTMIDGKGNERPIASNTNRLRYVLMGDPAMRLAVPDLLVRIDSLDGRPIGSFEPPQIKARQIARLSGSIVNPADGSTVTDFDGRVSYDLYDATVSRTTKDHEREDVTVTFDVPGQRLTSGTASVSGGRFSLRIPMPEQVQQNWRPASLNLAASRDGAEGAAVSVSDAVGLVRNIYIYDVDTSVEADTLAPEILYMYLNHESYAEGSTVHATPTLLAAFEDERGINLSTAGVGRQMTVTIDGRTTCSDLALYYTPETSVRGSLAYPLPQLTPGPHSLTLRVWDNDGNYAQASTDFVVDEGLQPRITDISTDANPATEQATFYVSHNQPDATLSLTVNVHSLDGRLVWSSTRKGRSNGNQAMPVTWNLCDGSGRRVARGIYIYRALLSTPDGSTYSSAAKKIAVAGQ